MDITYCKYCTGFGLWTLVSTPGTDHSSVFAHVGVWLLVFTPDKLFSRIDCQMSSGTVVGGIRRKRRISVSYTYRGSIMHTILPPPI